ncbi:MAG: ATP-grasp domain-containing protein [Sandaracinaceae bacterium]|nr:ATP-grasp domain-containing protein [Sandaracinaceae bacterium]
MRPVVFVAPFPLETTLRFARAAARLEGVALLGVVQELPRGADRHLFHDVVMVSDGLSTRQLIEAIEILRRRHGDPARIIGVLEPLQTQIALARKHFGVPGTDPVTAELFRDKAQMKDRLRAAGLPVARHALLSRRADAEAFAQRVGFPMVLKPPAGMGAKATFRVRDLGELLGALDGMHASPDHPVLGEEMLVGEEGSFDTITIAGKPRVASISHYLPTPLTVLENPWIQWCALLPRDVNGPEFSEVRRVGVAAIEALGLRDGFTHMEWFRRPDGSIVIGEIAQRPPGANITRMIGLAYDLDPYRAWARAVIDGAIDGEWERSHAVGCAFLRGIGRGRVRAVTGVAKTQEEIGKWVVEAKLPTLGAPKSDSYEGDGYVIVKDPRTEMVEKVLRHVIQNVQVHYG